MRTPFPICTPAGSNDHDRNVNQDIVSAASDAENFHFLAPEELTVVALHLILSRG
jgi:hypothetical protein